MFSLQEEKIEAISPGLFKGRSYFRKKTSVLKSGICKYYRRAQFDKFEWCVMEMFLFQVKGDASEDPKIKSSCKAVVTNLINRLKILLMEEVVPNQVGKIAQGIDLLDEFNSSPDFYSRFVLLKKFLRLVKKMKRARLVSYVNNWWRYHPLEIDLNFVKINRISEFKKGDDTSEILKLGERFIKYLRRKDERIFGVFDKIYNSKAGVSKRYRREDPVYLVIEILEKFFNSSDLMLKIIDFAKKQLFRKDMKERRAFGIWIVMIAWCRDDWKLSRSKKADSLQISEKEMKEYFKKREDIQIDEYYVINDHHVDKSNSVKKFRKEGAMVIDEDLALLGENGEEYRDYYADSLGEVDEEKPSHDIHHIKQAFQKMSKKTPSPTVIKEALVKVSKIFDKEKMGCLDDLKVIPWDEFGEVEVMEAGVCGGKVCCIRVQYNGKSYILKEMRATFNYGRDYYFLDKMKPLFGVTPLTMKRIYSTKRLERVDKKKRTLVGNWRLADTSEMPVYCMMDDFKNIGDIGKQKHFLERDADIYRECLKIRLFDGLFRSSDNILRNILVNEKGELMSIDEGDIFGKRERIFNKIDWMTNKHNLPLTEKLSRDIIREWNLPEKISDVAKQMKRDGFGDKIPEMKERFASYEEIVMKEIE